MKIKNMKTHQIGWIVAIFLSLTACVDELDFDKFNEVSPSPNLLLPAIDISVRLADLVSGDSVLTQDADGFLRFVYEEDSLISMNATEFVSIPAQEPFRLDNIPIIQDSTLSFVLDAGLSSLGSMELEQINFDRLGLLWGISTPALENATVTFTLNNAFKNGSVVQVVAQNNGPGDSEGVQFFEDVLFDLTQSSNPNSPPYNNLSLGMEITPDPATPTGTPFTITFGIDSTDLQSVSGYFGQRPVNIPSGSFNLDLGNIADFTSGFTLTDPSLTFKMNNGMGVSMVVSMDLDGSNTDGDITQLNPPSFNVAQATAPGSPVQTNFTMNNGNSNIVGFLDALPTQLIYSGQMSLNPNNTGGVSNFLSDGDVLQVGMEIDLPMELRTSNLGFEEEFDMGLAEEDIIDFLALEFESRNGFPFELNLTLSFLDSTGLVTDSVLMPLLEPAVVDANGRVVQSTTSNLEVQLTSNQINRLTKAPRWRLKGRVATPNNGTTPTKLYADYELGILFSIKGRVKVSEL
jgi:hypothetical protein